MGTRLEFLPADVLGLTPLQREALSGRLAGAGLALARSPAEIAPPVEGGRSLALDERAALAHSLEEHLAQLEPPVAVIDAVRRLASPEASLVLARRPAGLLASPLALLHAGAQALRLADELARRWGRPVVPALWVDDTSAEPPRAFVLSRHHDLTPLSLRELGGGGLPYRVPLAPSRHGLLALRAVLAQLHGDHAHLEAALDVLLPREGESLTAATVRSLTTLLGARGLVVIDPASLRSELAAALAEVAGADPRRAFADCAQALGEAGHAVQSELDTSVAALREAPGRLERLLVAGEGFRSAAGEGSRTPAELAAAVVQEPTIWSPGAGLLPACLELVLPLGVHLLEPEELLPTAACGALLRRLGRTPRPLALRAGVTLVDAPVRTSLTRLGLSVEEVLRRGRREDETQSKAISSQGGTPEPSAAVEQRIRSAAAQARAIVLGPRASLSELDRGLAGQLARTASRLAAELEALARRAERARAHHAGHGQRHARLAESALRPRGEPQEEVLSPFALLARHGTDWISGLVDELGPLGVEHQVLDIVPAQTPPRAPRDDSDEVFGEGVDEQP